jgi:hypothetical protein
MLASIQESMALVRLREDLPDRKLEAGHDVPALQNVGFGEGGDIGGGLVNGSRTLLGIDHYDHLRTGIEPGEDFLFDLRVAIAG